MKLSEVAAVVVHHRSPESLSTTVNRVLEEGILPQKLVVVDNSEQPGEFQCLKENLPTGVTIIASPNLGYGAAVNLGVNWHADHGTVASQILVSTHESLPEPGAIRELVRVLIENPGAAVVGPTLVTGEAADIVWSQGGYFTPVLNLPRHFGHRSSRSTVENSLHRPVSWLDGAFLLFRREVIEQFKIDERYFLYLEETDHQLQLTRAGWNVLIAPQAVVWQSSNGVPPYYQTRNIQLFQRKNGNVYQGLVCAPYLTLRGIVRSIYKREGSSSWKPLVAGLKDGLRIGRTADEQINSVHIINPLGGALAHYSGALEAVLRSAGASVTVSSVLEPSVAGTGRLAWLRDYMALLSAAGRKRGRDKSHTLVVWPALGFVDLVLARLLGGRAVSVVYHDPRPLVRAMGTGAVTARLVSGLPFSARAIVHSQTAARDMVSAGFKRSHALLAHPMFSPPPAVHGRSAVAPRPAVRVLGQYKQDRDLEVLRLLASELGGQFELEIVGRGWPEVTGWKVDARFVAESELDMLISSSSAVLIPYKRFYQSGIAIRALENGTPVVGRAGTSLDALYGADSKLLVREGSDGDTGDVAAWVAAVKYATSVGAFEAVEAGRQHFNDVAADWQQWLRSRHRKSH